MDAVIKRIYVHNFRCLENFEINLSELSSALLIGKNGVGKTALSQVLFVFQRIARGVNRVGDLVHLADFTNNRAEVPIRFEIHAEIGNRSYSYSIAFEFPAGFKELRVREEKLSMNGSPVFEREFAQVSLRRKDSESKFMIDWHLVALPIVQESSPEDSISVFREWLSRMLILRPVPGSIDGRSSDENLWPETSVSNFGAWFAGTVSLTPAAYSKIDKYLKLVMPDFAELRNPAVGTEQKSLFVRFEVEGKATEIPFAELSDGEKCLMVSALALAANEAYGPLFCFWDEPDNFLAPSEVGHLIVALRKGFESGGQFVATSHNPEAIRRFSNDNTFLLTRNSHLEPARLRLVNELDIVGDLVDALVRNDI